MRGNFLIVLILALAALGTWRLFRDVPSDAEFRVELGRRFEEEDAALEAALAAFSAGLPELTSAALAPARNNIAPLTAELASWNGSLRLAYALAAGKDAPAKFLVAKFEKPLLIPAMFARAEIGELLRSYRYEAARRDRLFRAGLALEAEEWREPEPGDQAFRQWLGGLAPAQDSSAELAVGNTALLAGTALEAVFIRQSAALLARLFAGIGARMAGAAAAAGVSAAADGPLLVGDVAGGVILIGGTAWSGIDFYRIRVALPVRLGAELNRALDTYEAALNREALESARAITEEYRESRRKLRRELERR